MHLLLFKMELVPKLLSRAESFLPAPDMVKLRSAVPAGWLKNYVLGAPVVTVLHKTLMSFPWEGSVPHVIVPSTTSRRTGFPKLRAAEAGTRLGCECLRIN